jgi:site-specific DNA-cytosine methylase
MGPHLRKGSQFFRKLTPIEASRLQGIPDHVYETDIVDDKQKYKQLGNAVNVGIVKTVARVLLGMDHPDNFLNKDDMQKNLFQQV